MENLIKDQRSFPGDHFINSHNIFSCLIRYWNWRREFMLFTPGA